MTSDPTVEDTAPSPFVPEPDAHGQAALLLIESVLHTLIETSVLTVQQAIEVVRTASEVKAEVAEAGGESNARMEASLALLEAISTSLETDGDPLKAAIIPG